MNETIYPVIGELHDHWSSTALGTPYKQFFWDGGVDGLANVEGDTLHLLAFNAAVASTGSFRAFIKACKAAYPNIRIWCVMNSDLKPVLTRYEFTRGHDVDKFGDMQEVWDWRKP